MKRLKYFSFFLAVNCETRTDSTINCIEQIEDAKEFGYLKYDQYKLETCQTILENTNEFSSNSCKVEGSTKSHIRNAEKIQCTKKDDKKCPSSPTSGCTRDDEDPTDTDKFCIYTCTEETLKCPDKIPDNRAFVDTTFAYCFNEDVSDCEFKDANTDDTNQLDFTCDRRPCGYSPPPTDFDSELTFDGSNFNYKIVADSDQTGDFGCKGQTYQHCTCSTDDSFKRTAILTCPEEAYTSKCVDEKKCVNNECFKGLPIVDFEYNNCDVVDENMISYCKRDVKVKLPCGNLEHTCDKNPTTGKNDCECDAIEADCVCGANQDDCVAAWNNVSNKCEANDIDIEDPMAKCEMTCFDAAFEKEACVDNSITNWQCYDDFTKMSTTNPDESHIKTEKINGTYEDIELCSERECPEGNCICKDTVLDEAKNYCSAVGDFYVSEHDHDHDDHDHKRSDEEITEPTSIVYQCMFFMDDYAAINNINDVDSKSNCSELKPPNDGENAICPVGQGACHTMKESGNSTFTAFGFFKCMCEKECSYGCGKSSYDAVFEDDFDATKDPYSTYTCEKDNLVMIICTSIFVPLGVAGIAAGVYFFFFHESSEVAPVETDNELATTQSSEDKPVEEDKEETKSEIQNDN